MKRTVLDLSYLQTISPFFQSKLGAYLGRKLFKWCSIDKVNEAHSKHAELRGAAFTSALLKDPLIEVGYEVHHAERLDGLPEGAFITVSNHPIGSLDGIILIDLFAARRPDFRVMVNGILSLISAMDDNFIHVTPDSKRQGPNMQNVNGVRAALGHLQNGHPLGLFPAGAISFYYKRTGEVRDHAWTKSMARLIRKADVPVYPVYFDFRNSSFFYWLGRISWKLRTFFIPREVFNKHGQKAQVYIGEPILPEKLHSFDDDRQLSDFLYRSTYAAKDKANN
ncbi:MAG: lysophospholipid acyltransferase family protein [Tannerella sp.]|jgi:putative hemolysin|nr:lysophospholipid acyltransferase family protein [Tannerella sp.]